MRLVHASSHEVGGRGPPPCISGAYDTSTPLALPASPALPLPVARLAEEAAGARLHTHLLDALQSVVGLLDVTVHRIHSGRFAGLYPRAMNVVQPVKTEDNTVSLGLGQARASSHPHLPTQACWPLPRGSPAPGGGARPAAAQPFPRLSAGLRAGGVPGCSSWVAHVSTGQV